MRGTRNSIRPQDILIALKVLLLERRGTWNQLRLARELSISPAEIAFALKRLRKHHLLDDDKKTIKRAALLEFLVHGVKYVFPSEIGPPSRGLPTSISHALKGEIRVSDEMTLVWPDPEGKVRGNSLIPLYETVPDAAKVDEELHLLLALMDVIRVGGTRAVNLAIKNLEKAILYG